jgi:hypothetical protein
MPYAGTCKEKANKRWASTFHPVKTLDETKVTFDLRKPPFETTASAKPRTD